MVELVRLPGLPGMRTAYVPRCVPRNAPASTVDPSRPVASRPDNAGDVERDAGQSRRNARSSWRPSIERGRGPKPLGLRPRPLPQQSRETAPNGTARCAQPPRVAANLDDVCQFREVEATGVAVALLPRMPNSTPLAPNAVSTRARLIARRDDRDPGEVLVHVGLREVHLPEAGRDSEAYEHTGEPVCRADAPRRARLLARASEVLNPEGSHPSAPGGLPGSRRG
jgi:hypothetical protein